jgi:hypothetical protein
MNISFVLTNCKYTTFLITNEKKLFFFTKKIVFFLIGLPIDFINI